MPVILPTEIKLKIVKHYIDLAVHEAASMTEIDVINYQRLYGNSDDHRTRGKVCVSSIETLLAGAPELTVETYKIVRAVHTRELKGYMRLDNSFGPRDLGPRFRTVSRKYFSVYEGFKLRLVVVLRVLDSWFGMEWRLGTNTGIAEGAVYFTPNH